MLDHQIFLGSLELQLILYVNSIRIPKNTSEQRTGNKSRDWRGTWINMFVSILHHKTYFLKNGIFKKDLSFDIKLEILQQIG